VLVDERALQAEQAWRNVVDWCRIHAPLTADALHGPANEEALAAAQDEMGLEWRRNSSLGCGWVTGPTGAVPDERKGRRHQDDAHNAGE